MSRWHSIVITDGSSTKLHTFDYVPRIKDQERNVEQPRLAWHHRAVVDGIPDAADIAVKQLALWRPGMSPYEYARAAAHRAGYRRYLPQTFNHVPLEDISTRLDIAKGFNPTGRTLAYILNVIRVRDASAMPPHRFSSVELSDLKSVDSKFGSMISKIDSLSREKRRRAEKALYNAISAQCGTM